MRRFPSGRCQARYLDPETHRFTPPPQTFATKGAADRWLNRKRAELDAGTAIDEKAASEPLSHWWPGHWRSLQSRKPTTRVNHSTAWRLRIEPRFGTLPVRRIKPSHIDDWIADMNQDGVSPTKVIEAVGVLRRVLDSRARLRSGSIWPLVSALIRVPVHFYVSRMRNQPIELTEEANMAATSS